MKTIIALATALAALATTSVASARDTAGGHWEWRTSPSVGPKATAPTRVWVKNDKNQIASCACSMMKADAAGCMMDMPGNGRAPSAG